MTVVIVVVLPMDLASFNTSMSKFLASVASTANVPIQNVTILSAKEFSARRARAAAKRLLSGFFVSVQTAIITTASNVDVAQNQKVLDLNLAQNGMPSGTIADVSVSVTTATSLSPNASPTAAASHVPVVGYALGGAAGGLCLLCLVSYFVWKVTKGKPASSHNVELPVRVPPQREPVPQFPNLAIEVQPEQVLIQSPLHTASQSDLSCVKYFHLD